MKVTVNPKPRKNTFDELTIGEHFVFPRDPSTIFVRQDTGDGNYVSLVDGRARQARQHVEITHVAIDEIVCHTE